MGSWRAGRCRRQPGRDVEAVRDLWGPRLVRVMPAVRRALVSSVIARFGMDIHVSSSGREPTRYRVCARVRYWGDLRHYVGCGVARDWWRWHRRTHRRMPLEVFVFRWRFLPAELPTLFRGRCGHPCCRQCSRQGHCLADAAHTRHSLLSDPRSHGEKCQRYHGLSARARASVFLAAMFEVAMGRAAFCGAVVLDGSRVFSGSSCGPRGAVQRLEYRSPGSSALLSAGLSPPTQSNEGRWRGSGTSIRCPRRGALRILMILPDRMQLKRLICVSVAPPCS